MTSARTILIIEDEADILFTLKEFLEFEGYKVLTAENGLQALKILEKAEMPNLILLDMKMPVMNGWEFAIEFQKKHNHMAPILVMTAAADANERAKDIRADGWIAKPFDLDLCLEKIRKYERVEVASV